MLSRNHPDRIQVTCDDHRLVSNAGLLLPTTLAQRLVPFPDRFVNAGKLPLTLDS